MKKKKNRGKSPVPTKDQTFSDARLGRLGGGFKKVTKGGEEKRLDVAKSPRGGKRDSLKT